MKGKHRGGAWKPLAFGRCLASPGSPAVASPCRAGRVRGEEKPPNFTAIRKWAKSASQVGRMELRRLPEALKVEIQCHQNGDLKKQIHERQSRIAALNERQALGTIAAVPITVPQVSSLQRLAGHRPAVLPQVRPKTLIPDSLPISPCRDQPSKQPSAFQKATVVSIKNPTPALPTANNTVSHVQTPNSQSQSVTESTTTVSAPLSTTGVAYAIISTSPNNAVPINTSATVSVVNDGIKVQPLLISADSKVIIIQPQVQTQTENKVETKKAPEESAQGPPATKKKKEESPETPSVHSLASENCLYGSIRPGYNRILGRNPKQASGEEKKKHSQPGLQWAFGNREETSCIKLFEQPLVSVHKSLPKIPPSWGSKPTAPNLCSALLS
uniref:PHD finger protein 21B n=1 Tax=Podarcis muralis TaxID=64176 RepID=A0A670HR81_PODMU